MELQIPNLDLPEDPTNADLARAIKASLAATVDVHGCLENHVILTRQRDVVLSGQINGINVQLDRVITPALSELQSAVVFKDDDDKVVTLKDALTPINAAFVTYKKRRAWVLGAMGSIVIAVGSSAATGLYTALTTQHVAIQQDQNAATAIQTAATAQTTAATVAKTAPNQYTYSDSQRNWVEQRKVDAEMLAFIHSHSKKANP